MNSLEIIKKAIESQKPIEFEYNREDKVTGKRIGNPHILFNKVYVHIFQTGGVSDSGLGSGLPWRLFITDFIENVKVLSDKPSFEIAEGYNPDSVMYVDIIAKI